MTTTTRVRTRRKYRLGRFILSAGLITLSTTTVADSPCLVEFHSTFGKYPKVVQAIVDGYDWARQGHGRAQAEKVQEFINAKVEEFKSKNAFRKKQGQSEIAWENFIEEWELEVHRRTFGKRKRPGADYPTVNEMLALMAIKSNTFSAGLRSYLNHYGSIGYKIAAKLRESVRPGSPSLPHFYNMFRMSLPTPQTVTFELFAKYQFEISKAIAEALYPGPGWKHWFNSMRSLEIDIKNAKISWPFLRVFSEGFSIVSEIQTQNFINGVAADLKSSIRPEVVEQMAQSGPINTMMYRMTEAARAEFKTNQEMMKWLGELEAEISTGPLSPELQAKMTPDELGAYRARRAQISEFESGADPLLTPEQLDVMTKKEIDAHQKQRKSKAHKRAQKKADYVKERLAEKTEAFVAELKQNPAFVAECRQLALDYYFFTRPFVAALSYLIAKNTLFDGLYKGVITPLASGDSPGPLAKCVKNPNASGCPKQDTEPEVAKANLEEMKQLPQHYEALIAQKELELQNGSFSIDERIRIGQEIKYYRQSILEVRKLIEMEPGVK